MGVGSALVAGLGMSVNRSCFSGMKERRVPTSGLEKYE